MYFVLTVIWLLLWVIFIAMFAGMILSWIDPTRRWTITRIVFDITDPIVAPIRAIVPPVGFFDLSYLIAFVLIQVLRSWVESARI